MGRGWHHGKRVGARIAASLSVLPLPIGRARAFLGSPGIEENPSDFDPSWANRIQPGLLYALAGIPASAAPARDLDPLLMPDAG
jgi:hypothetical protein